jgi:hypothetical protein
MVVFAALNTQDHWQVLNRIFSLNSRSTPHINPTLGQLVGFYASLIETAHSGFRKPLST